MTRSRNAQALLNKKVLKDFTSIKKKPVLRYSVPRLGALFLDYHLDYLIILLDFITGGDGESRSPVFSKQSKAPIT